MMKTLKGSLLIAVLFCTSALAFDDAATQRFFDVAAKGAPEEIRGLIDQGANVNARDAQGRTALMATGNPDAAELLVRNGADVNAVTNTWRMYYAPERATEWPFHRDWGGWHGWSWGEDFPRRLRRGGGQNTLALAVQDPEKSVELLKKLIELGANLEAKDAWGETALLRAVTDGNVAVARKLLDLGADVNARNNEGTSSLMKTLDELYVNREMLEG